MNWNWMKLFQKYFDKYKLCFGTMTWRPLSYKIAKKKELWFKNTFDLIDILDVKNSYLIFCPLEFSSVFCTDDCYRDINEHADEDDETKVDVKIIGKSNDGNDDINDDGDERKKQGIKDFSDWIRSSVHNSENLSELSSIMPSDPKSMQMVKKVQFESFNCALTYTKLNKNI